MGTRSRRAHPGILLASAALLAPLPAAAQSVAPTREELTGATRPEPPPRPTLNIVGGVERSPCPLADPKFADVKVTIREVQFNNLKGASPAEMRTTWAPFAGSEQPVAVLCEIRDAAATLLRAKGVRPMTGRLAVAIEVFPPDQRRRDLDNLLKAIGDSLQHGGAFPDDSQIVWLLIEKAQVVPNGKVMVRITERR